MNVDRHCGRCGRAAPDPADQSYAEWESIEREDGAIGVICPGCVTGVEQQDADEDMMALVELLSRCSRCGRERPDFDSRRESPSYGDPESHGWYVVEGGLVCAACATVEEMLRWMIP